MLTQLQLSVRPVSQEDRQKLANLIHFEIYVHRHLDWRPPLDWVGHQPYLLAEQRGSVVAALACPPDPPQVAWIRLFAASSIVSLERAWRTLWPEAQALLAGNEQLEAIAAIPLQRWFQNLLEGSHFVETHRVVMLSWDREPISSGHEDTEIFIRPMNLDDMNAVELIDAASFMSVWQNSKTSLELAFRQAALATVAEAGGKLVGYQISTATPMGGHLARLAVLPEWQGHGIGFTLVRDMLSQFERRGAEAVTVNTQHDNHASLSLYKKAGFRLTGEEYPIYQLPLLS
jgi:ribosomal-protein-alanine N-acetyltransferase